MRAITLWQPWASLVALGHTVKPHETRSWGTPYRGPLLIHAAKRWTTDCREAWDQAKSTLEASGVGLFLPDEPPLGCVVAVAGRIESFGPGPDFGARPDHALDEAFGGWGPSRHAWRLHDVVPLPEPIPCGGYQGFWIPSCEVVMRLLPQTGWPGDVPNTGAPTP